MVLGKAVLLSLCMALAVATLSSPTTTSNNNVVHIINSHHQVDCSGDHCCSYGCTQTTFKSTLTRNEAPTSLPVNITTVGKTCDGLQCSCFSRWTNRIIVDLSAAVAAIKRPKRSNVVLTCQRRAETNGRIVSVTAVQLRTDKGVNGGYFPASFNANCSSSTQDGCSWATKTSTVNTWDLTTTTLKAAPFTIPVANLTDNAILSGGGVLIGFEASFGGDNMFDCQYGGQGWGAVDCTVDIVGA